MANRVEDNALYMEKNNERNVAMIMIVIINGDIDDGDEGIREFIFLLV